MTLYHHVREGHAVTLVEPTGYPEKFQSLLTAVLLADRVLFVVPGLTREVAEIATVVDLAGRPVTIVHRETVGAEEVRRALKGLSLVDAPIDPWAPTALRAAIDGWSVPAEGGPPRVPIDHAFPVKGVGAVVLGVVRGGPVDAHATLRLYPTDRRVEVRSIQVHDVDVPRAETGERVGLALKGIEADELARGQVLAPDGTLRADPVVRGGGLRRCPYYRGAVAVGSHLHLALGLQAVPVVVSELGPSGTVLTADRPLAQRPGEPAMLLDLSVAAGPRIVGRIDLPA